MESFSTYYYSNKTEYNYTLKLAVCELDEEKKEKIKKFLDKYSASYFSQYKKTPIQENPLDFPNVKNTEVYICDFTISYPMVQDTLAREIAEVSSIPLNQVVVYTQNDPRRATTQEYLDKKSSGFKDGYETKLGGKEDWPKEPPYGDAYNVEFLKALGHRKKEREEVYITNSLIPPIVTDDTTVTGQEKGKQNNTPVLNQHCNPEKNLKRRPNTLFSKE